MGTPRGNGQGTEGSKPRATVTRTWLTFPIIILERQKPSSKKAVINFLKLQVHISRVWSLYQQNPQNRRRSNQQPRLPKNRANRFCFVYSKVKAEAAHTSDNLRSKKVKGIDRSMISSHAPKRFLRVAISSTNKWQDKMKLIWFSRTVQMLQRAYSS